MWPRSVDPTLALGRPVMERRNRHASDLPNLLCGKHFPSIVSQAHRALPSRPQPPVVYYAILSSPRLLCDSHCELPTRPSPSARLPSNALYQDLRSLGYELTGDSLMSPPLSQTCRPTLVTCPRDHIAFHAIRRVTPRFVPKSVPKSCGPIIPARFACPTTSLLNPQMLWSRVFNSLWIDSRWIDPRPGVLVCQ
jgi:hypothetical protein